MAKISNLKYGSGPVNAGEERLFKYLEGYLPDDYYIIPNGEYAQRDPQGVIQYYEYDCIVVAPHAIYHIENKDWAGQLYGDDFYWYINGHERVNPFKGAEFKSRLLKGMLSEKNPDWRYVWITTLVTLSHPSQSKFGLDPNARSFGQVYTLGKELCEFIIDAERVRKKENAIQKYQKDIVDYLTGASSQRKPEDRTAILDFDIEEVLQQTELFTEYLVHPHDHNIKKFKVREYPLSVANLSPIELEKRKKKVENARTAQYHLSASSYIIKSDYRINDEGTVFYEVSEYMDDRTLSSTLLNKTLTQLEKIKIIVDIANALKVAHDGGVIHRDVCPSNIYILSDGTAALANFGKSWFDEHEIKDFTLKTQLGGKENPYIAPEILSGKSVPQSDIYSLGVIIYELMVGNLPFKDTISFMANGLFPDDLLPSHKDLPEWLDDVILKTITIEPEDRYEKVEDLIDDVTEHAYAVTDEDLQYDEDVDIEPFDIMDLEPTMQINNELVLAEELGHGGFGRVFKAKHIYQGEYYAVKFFDRYSSVDETNNEYLALKDLRHNNIVKFIYNGRSDQGLFFTMMELLDGENLSDYSYGKNDLRLPINELYKMMTQILDALVYMQSKGMYHRDIKPNNIVWDKRQRYVLIDFNISTAIQDDTAYAGTRPYMAPDLISNRDGYRVFDWDFSADTFSLGVTIYELLAHTYPWSGSDPFPKIKVPPTDIRVYNSPQQTLSEPFADFVMKSIITDRHNRFTTAKEMKDALEAIGPNGLLKAKIIPLVDISRKDVESVQEIDIVDYINSLYSQSSHGNAGTRASLTQSNLDNLTYTETKLHRHLIEDIQAGKYKLVIITGNAGDGKTALIHEIEKKGEDRQTIAGMNGSKFRIGGISFESNYDGSQDENEKLNDEVLESFFSPFKNLSDYSQASAGRIIAINEGRLVDFLSKQEGLKTLHDNIDEYFYQRGRTDLLPGLMVINLNLRSVTARGENGESLLHSQIKKLTNPDLWTKCENCPIKEHCFIKYNVNTFQDINAGDEVINRLEWLIRTIVYKRELHITMRDLRSFIAFMLTRDYSCAQVKAMIKSADQMPPEFYWQFYYFNVTAPEFFKKEGTNFPFPTCESNDRLVHLLKETDIARVSLPANDRDLYYKKKDEADYLVFGDRKQPLLSVFNGVGDVIPSYEISDDAKSLMRVRHQSLIRHQYFEGSSDKKKFDFTKRLPYKYLKDFYSYLQNKTEEENYKVMKSIAKAISKSEGCLTDEKMLDNYMLLSCTHINDPLSKSYRLFKLDDFCIVEEDNKHLVEYLEYENDSFIFRHKDDDYLQLTVSLDLYEMLEYINKGFSPSINDMQGKFVELQIFKNLLESKSYHEILVTKNNKKFFVIRLNNDKTLEIEPLNQQTL